MFNLYETRLISRYKTVLVKEREIETGINRLNSIGDVVFLMNYVFHMDTLAEEFCYMIALNTKNRILGVFLISKGTIDSSIVNPRDIFVRALLCGAANITLIHNHPSGDVSPSRDDKNMTKRVKDSGELIGVFLQDHIIIGGNTYYSFKEQGIL